MPSIERSLSFNEVFFSNEEGLFLNAGTTFNINKNSFNILKRLEVDGCYQNSLFLSREIEDKSKYYFMRGYSGANNSFLADEHNLTIELEGPNAEALIKSSKFYSSIFNQTTVISSTKVRIRIFSEVSLGGEVFDSHNEEFVFDADGFEVKFSSIFTSISSLKTTIENFNALYERVQKACSLECGRVVVSVPQNNNANLSGIYDVSVWTSGTQMKELKERSFFDAPYFGTLTRESQKQITEKHLTQNSRPILHNFKISDATGRAESHSLTIDYSIANNIYCQCTNTDNDGELLIKNYYYLSGTKSVTNLTTSTVTVSAIAQTGLLVECVTDLNNITISI